ncbi:type VII secretion integral membrane protein EccD [Nocardia sp. NPDC050793]|uniref:type VII secretion integral membrane protein EccD n=1 Tax=Nocardia sp. NPDC050793 TaxID=3155159 RepID=UPI0033C91E17
MSTSQAAEQSAEVARARIAVIVASYQVDVVVPTKFTIETFIDDLIAVLKSAIDDEDVDFTPPHGQWSLARPGEQPIPRWRSLNDHDIVDGTVLMLCPVESAEVFTPVVEDITDALALINDREFAEFDPATAMIMGLVVLGAGVGAVAALSAWSWTRTGSAVWCLFALAVGATCWVAAVMARNRGAGTVSAGLALAALAPMFAGGATIVPPAYTVPGPFAAPNVAAGAAITAAVAAVLARTCRIAITELTAVTVLGMCATIAMVPLTLSVSVGQVSAAMTFVGVVLLSAAPRLAVVIARIRPPDLPDPGNEVSPATLTDIFDAQTRPDDLADSDEDSSQRAEPGGAPSIEGRARLAVKALRGLIIAIVVLLVAASTGVVLAGPGGIREIVLAAAVAGILVMRARWYPDRVQAIALITGAAVVVASAGVVLTETYSTTLARLTVAVVIGLAALAGCLAALRLPDKRLSPVTRRIIDLIEYALLVAVPVLAFWIMGVYAAMRRL